MKGVVIELPPDLANELREGGKAKKNTTEAPDDDEWNQLIPMPKKTAPVPKTPAVQAVLEDDFSLPDTMPAIELIWERLLGYIPEDEFPMEQLHEALWSTNESLDKLMAAGIAQHTTRSVAQEKSRIVVAYPEFIMNTDKKLVSTARSWKALVQKHEVPVVERLLGHLRDCHRSLWWKAGMGAEIRSLVESEIAWREMEEWKKKRPQQLQDLYKARETLEHIYEEACAKVDQLEAERDEAVRDHVLKRSDGILNNDDLLDLFPPDDDDDDEYNNYLDEADFLGAEDTYSIHSESTQHSQSDTDENEEHPVSGDGATATTLPTSSAEVVGNNSNDDEVTRTTADVSDWKEDASYEPQQDQQLEGTQLQQSAPLAEEVNDPDQDNTLADKGETNVVTQTQDTIEAFKDQATSAELKMAQAAAQVLQQRLDRIDDLLETLQDQEWEAEEEAAEEIPPTTTAPPTNQFGLLDQILAMILGSRGLEPQDLFRQHMEIVHDWKQHFGRLPSSGWSTQQQEQQLQPPKVNQAELKESLGIVDNYESDWDSDPEEAPSPPPQKVGLRPGGRLIM